eukprot:4045458-Alexandrium_andersonii.AAC.1
MPPVPVCGFCYLPGRCGRRWRSGQWHSLQPGRQQRCARAGPARGLLLATRLAWLRPCAAASGVRALCSGRDGAHQWSGLARGPSL